MANTRNDFLAAARSAADLLRAPAVAAEWTRPSVLPEFSVGGVAGHLAHQIVMVRQILAEPVPEEPPIGLLEHFEREEWLGADLTAAANVRIREAGESAAAGGPLEVVAPVDAAITALSGLLVDSPDRPVRIPWGPWSLRLDDLLVTRMLELVVHSDDLAVSVGMPTPELRRSAVDTVVALLSRLAVRRHGPTGVLRALSRAERAPANVAAI